ncbi:MAG: phosphoribosylaminoimidazolesuccinocarboxamide synthase [Cytophagales bacterium]|nr:MAG: phosphoribosylaminoimidazolesuccinocarboxamide synthase [Cytophagales bacterium]
MSQFPETINETVFTFPKQEAFYRGKVREVYIFKEHLAIISSDRISAFDVILPRCIPYKGQVLNQLSLYYMQQTQELVPNWILYSPDPNVAFGLRCEAFPIEMVIRGYLAGSAWRAYRDGKRIFNGHQLPDGLQENDKLPQPIITPTTKAAKGDHDEDIDNDEIIKNNLATHQDYEQLLHYTKVLYEEGSKIAHSKGFILADTKYEFGKNNGKIYLIDEIHTLDSARYFESEGYEERQENKTPQPQRSKEMVRQWLIANGFQGQAGQKIPTMTDEWVMQISKEYTVMYERMTQTQFLPPETKKDRLLQIEQNILDLLK